MMILNTRPENRKEMVKVISELTGMEATYMYTPTYAFEIGPVTVNRDGTITSEDETAIAAIKPLLIERGWLEADTEPEALKDSEAIPEPDTPVEVARMDLGIPVEGWTVNQMTNLLRLLYSKQILINRMINCDMLYIEESFVKAISENPPEAPVDFEERVHKAIEAECISGFNLADSKATLSVPAAGDDPERWKAYVHLWSAILRLAKAAARINLKQVDDPENEKYHANSWLMRMDFGGADFKETRRILMGHLNGFAAFKNAADMEAHKARQTQRRNERRINAQGGSDENAEA